MRTLFLFLAILLLSCISSCRSDFETVPSSGDLFFSRDTVYLDTVFKNIGSSTYQLKVYNKSKKDISIPTIQFKNGLNSKYRMSVDGMSGTNGRIFSNVTLLAKDSLFIFIETTADISDAEPKSFLYTDKILFDTGPNQQVVDLVTLIKDAIFLYPSKNADGSKETITIEDKNIEGFYLNENDPENGNELIFTKQKPYVIYGYASVPEHKTVQFQAGTRVYFHANSGIYVGKNATLQINGFVSTTEFLEHEVIFEGDRLESNYDEIAGQWGKIWLGKGSLNNSINHLTLKNATEGLYIQNTNQTITLIKNTQIYNCVNYGILAENAKIKGSNIAINNSGKANLFCSFGGNYEFTHCTFNNNWNNYNQVAVSISNLKENTSNDGNDLLEAAFNNCIIYSTYADALRLDKAANVTFNYKLTNCLLKSSNKEIGADSEHYANIILNESPQFLNVTKNQLYIDRTSSAFAKGYPAYLISADILGNTRTLPPDLGAYQSRDFPEKKK